MVLDTLELWQSKFEDLCSLANEVKKNNTDRFMEYWNNKLKEFNIFHSNMTAYKKQV